MFCSFSAVVMSGSFMVTAVHRSCCIHELSFPVRLNNLVQVDHIGLDDLEPGSQERDNCSFAHSASNHSVASMCCFRELLVNCHMRQSTIQDSVATNMRELVTQF